jgi:hypothetical protein
MTAIADFFGTDHTLGVLHQYIARLPLDKCFFVSPEVIEPHYMTDNAISLG